MTTIEAIQRERQPAKQAMVLLIAAMLGGCVHQLLFYGKDWGVSYPLFVLLFYVYFYWSIRERHELRFGAELLFLLPIALLSLTYAAFTNFLFTVLNALAVPLLILMHTTWTVRQNELRWFDAAMVPAVLEQVFVHSLRYVPLPIQTVARAISGRMKTGRSQQLWKVLAGIVLSLPILLLVGSLLASADAIFEKTVSKLPQWLGEIEFGTVIFRILWIAAVGSGMFIYIWGLLYPKQRYITNAYWEADEAEFERKFGTKPAEARMANAEQGITTPTEASTGAASLELRRPTRLDPTIVTTVLVMLNAVYVLFAAVQFSYFFGSGAGLLPNNVTYAEYARRGFAELVIVTVINFTMLMIALYGVDRSERPVQPGLTNRANQENEPVPGSSTGRSSAALHQSDRSLSRVITILLTLLIGCTGIMLSSAYMRLSLYEVAYGFTMTRVLVHAFMLYLLLLFIIALFKLWKGKLPLMKLYLITSVVAYVVLNYVQADAIIAVKNMERYEETGKIDIAYLQSLSFESVPYLIRLEQKHPEVAGAQQALQVMRQRIVDGQHHSWMEFNVSERRAAEALRRLSEQEKPQQP